MKTPVTHRAVRSMLTSVLAGLFIAAAPASGTIIPRDGAWAGTAGTTFCDPDDGCSDTDELGYFTLRARVVGAMSYTVVITCYDRETRQPYDRYFTGGKAFPRNTRIPGLLVTRRYDEVSEGRSGAVTTTLDYRGSRAKLLVRVQIAGTVDGTYERCNGRTTIPLRRGPLPPPA
jgi:hypothetical protein